MPCSASHAADTSGPGAIVAGVRFDIEAPLEVAGPPSLPAAAEAALAVVAEAPRPAVVSLAGSVFVDFGGMARC